MPVVHAWGARVGCLPTKASEVGWNVIATYLHEIFFFFLQPLIGFTVLFKIRAFSTFLLFFSQVTNAQLEALRIENRHLRDTALNEQLTVSEHTFRTCKSEIFFPCIFVHLI